MSRRDASDAEDVGRHEAKAKEARRQELKDFRAIMDTPGGRRHFLRMLDRTGVFKVSFDNSGSITARNEGMRLIGLSLWADLEAIDGLSLYATALREAQESSDT